MSMSVGREFIGLSDLGNKDIALGILFLSVLQPKLLVIDLKKRLRPSKTQLL
jgi:hypothetical protein